jgi:hypothetical protein
MMSCVFDDSRAGAHCDPVQKRAILTVTAGCRLMPFLCAMFRCGTFFRPDLPTLTR